MQTIHLLDQETVNKIAAGEVVERPMAVVKELVENSIDAGATAITIEIKDGGKKLIRITDNGMGIDKDDIKLAFTPHATSKISDVSDLLTIGSLGFRGEALASIAAVSELEMLTKRQEDLLGSRYVINGGREKELSEAGCPNGTTVIVRNLFYNVPAREKFLKSSMTEAGYIGGIVEKLVLSHPEISFRYINQERLKINTNGNGKLKDVIYQIYGRDITENLIKADAKEVFCNVGGYMGKPVISKGNQSFMNYFINGRYIKSNVIKKAIEQAYSGYTMQHRFPFTVLHFDIDKKYIDVNVHPQKMEIRFTREQEIFQSIYHALTESLKVRELSPDVNLIKREYGIVTNAQTSSGKNEMFEVNRIKAEEQNAKRKDIEEKIQYKAPDSSESIRDKEADSGKNTDINIQEGLYEKKYEDKKKPDLLREEGIFSENNKVVRPKQQSLFDIPELKQEKTKDIRIIGQVFSTYWVMEYDEKMYIIDQHAAHEKVLYERFVKEISQRKVIVQNLNPPIIISLSSEEENILLQHEDIFINMGFVFENFGGKEYAITGIPMQLPIQDPAVLFMEILSDLLEINIPKTPEMLSDRIATMACKAAVKGNNILDSLQAKKLIEELMTLKNPFHCPHGRPTVITMTKYELERKFKRIM